MPDLIRHPEGLERTGFRLSPAFAEAASRRQAGMTKRDDASLPAGRQEIRLSGEPRIESGAGTGVQSMGFKRADPHIPDCRQAGTMSILLWTS